MNQAKLASNAPRLCVFTRAWRSSGAGLFAQELVDGLRAAGGDVTFVAPPVESAAFERPRAHLRRIRPPRELVGNEPRVQRLAVSLLRIFGGALGLLRARFGNRVFIVSIPDPLPFSVPMLALLKLSGARILFIAHDPLPHAWRLPPVLRRLERAAHGACYRLADAVVVLSAPSRDELRRAFPRLTRPVEVIEHGVFLLGEPTPLRGDGLLLTFGTLRRNKGIVEAIEGVVAARAGGARIRLLIAGAFHKEDRDYSAQCAALAAAAGDAVDMRIGYVPDEMLRDLFDRCDALLMPYIDFFSQSGVALLAASNARPVIASAAGGIGALIGEGMPAEVIAAPVTAGSVADAIDRYVATPAEVWRARAQDYRGLTLERRSWHAIGAQYLALAQRFGA